MVAVSVLVVIWSVLGIAVAQRASTPKAQGKLALRGPEVKQWLRLMDTDENGKISKHEWMQFMEADFDRLDKDNRVNWMLRS